MNKKYTFLLALAAVCTGNVFGGNPDRQGEAGANQLLINHGRAARVSTK